MWYLVVFIASIAVSYALAPKPPTPQPSSLSDLNVPTAQTGKGIKMIYGTCRIQDPNIVWYGDLRTQAIKSSSK